MAKENQEISYSGYASGKDRDAKDKNIILTKNPKLGLKEVWPEDDQDKKGIPSFKIVNLAKEKDGKHPETGVYQPTSMNAVRSLVSAIDYNTLTTIVDPSSKLTYSNKLPENSQVRENSHLTLDNTGANNVTVRGNSTAEFHGGRVSEVGITDKSNIYGKDSYLTKSALEGVNFEKDMGESVVTDKDGKESKVEAPNSTYHISGSHLRYVTMPAIGKMAGKDKDGKDVPNELEVRGSSITGGSYANAKLNNVITFVDPKSIVKDSTLDNTRIDNRTVTIDMLQKARDGQDYPYQRDEMSDMINNSKLDHTLLAHDKHGQFTVDNSNLKTLVSPIQNGQGVFKDSQMAGQKYSRPILAGAGLYDNAKVNTQRAAIVLNPAGLDGTDDNGVLKDVDLKDSDDKDLQAKYGTKVQNVNFTDPDYKALVANKDNLYVDKDPLDAGFDVGNKINEGEMKLPERLQNSLHPKAVEAKNKVDHDITDDLFD